MESTLAELQVYFGVCMAKRIVPTQASPSQHSECRHSSTDPLLCCSDIVVIAATAILPAAGPAARSAQGHFLPAEALTDKACLRVCHEKKNGCNPVPRRLKQKGANVGPALRGITATWTSGSFKDARCNSKSWLWRGHVKHLSS